MAVTAKSLREKVDAIKGPDGKHDPAARISLCLSDALYLANQLDVMAGNEISAATESRLKKEGHRDIHQKAKEGLANMRCAIAGRIAKGDIKNLRAAFVANALLDVAEEAWWGATGHSPHGSSADNLLTATENMLAAMDRLQELAKWQLVPQISNDASNLARPVTSLDVSVRATNCLVAEGIITVGDLIQRTKVEIARIPNLGTKSMNEILEAMKTLGLSLAG